MKKIALLFILLLIASFRCNAQYETDTHIVWQPGVKLTFEMFQGAPSDSACVQKMESLNIYHQMATGFWAALDVPDSRRRWKTMKEKYSFCAAMDKTQSFFIVRDSTELKYAQLIWDICEVATRISRKKLVEFEKEANDKLAEKYGERKYNGVISIAYASCLNDGKQFGQEMKQTVLNEVIKTHDEEAYLQFRTMIDTFLLELEEYATTEEEIKRLLSDNPAKGYKLAPTVVGDLKKRGEILY